MKKRPHEFHDVINYIFAQTAGVKMSKELQNL